MTMLMLSTDGIITKGEIKPLGKITKDALRCLRTTVRQLADLLPVVGCVRQHCGHMEHQLVVLVGGVERVRARGVRCKTREGAQSVSRVLMEHYSKK